MFTFGLHVAQGRQDRKNYYSCYADPKYDK